MLLTTHAAIEDSPLQLTEMPVPEPGPGQVLVQVAACGVCRSNLHMVEGDWPGVPSRSPIIPGHEVVGVIASCGPGVEAFAPGDRVGVQPIWSTCGHCAFCVAGRENLCQSKEITGETVDGGYAEYMLATAAHTYALPDSLSFADAAPLFCPGITAYGCLSKADLSPVKSAAVFGVGGVGHVVLQMALLFGSNVYAVTRSAEHLQLAAELGGIPVDAGALDPVLALNELGGVDASFVFAPSDAVVAQAIAATKPGGVVILGVNATVGRFSFADEKRVVGSILGSRQQMREVLELAAAGKIKAYCESRPLEKANEALVDLKQGHLRARIVLTTGI